MVLFVCFVQSQARGPTGCLETVRVVQVGDSHGVTHMRKIGIRRTYGMMHTVPNLCGKDAGHQHMGVGKDLQAQ